MTTTRTAAAEAEARAVTARELLSKRADALQDVLRPAWDTDREIASQNASMVQGGAGWFGGITGGNKAVADAERELGRWAEKWPPTFLNSPMSARPSATPPGIPTTTRSTPRCTTTRVAAPNRRCPSKSSASKPPKLPLSSPQRPPRPTPRQSPSTRSAEAAVHASTGWRDLAKKLPQLNQRVNDLRGQL